MKIKSARRCFFLNDMDSVVVMTEEPIKGHDMNNSQSRNLTASIVTHIVLVLSFVLSVSFVSSGEFRSGNPIIDGLGFIFWAVIYLMLCFLFLLLACFRVWEINQASS